MSKTLLSEYVNEAVPHTFPIHVCVDVYATIPEDAIRVLDFLEWVLQDQKEAGGKERKGEVCEQAAQVFNVRVANLSVFCAQTVPRLLNASLPI